MVFEHVRLNDIPGIASKLVELTDQTALLCFYGEMGSGKTTLIREVCRQLGVSDPVSSPTYPIIHEYAYPKGVLYHIDLFRLRSQEEALQIGLEDYLYSGHPCFIEWPDHFESLLPEQKIKIFIRKLDDDSRQIEITAV